MTKGAGTRSGLLWEVERLLKECYKISGRIDANYGMPQILLMENVPQVHSQKNLEDFELWLKFLKEMGYENYYKDLNARNYGIAQNRNRCFMISILGNYTYTFPKEITLNKVMKDYLEDEVEEKYYITSEKARKLIDTLILDGKLPQKDVKNIDNKTNVIGCMDNTEDHTFESANRVYDIKSAAPTVNTCGGGGLQPKIIDCKVIGGIGEKKSNGASQYYQQDRVYSMGDVSLCLPAQLPNGSYNYLDVKKMNEIKCVAMRGRYIDDFSSAKISQKLEFNGTECTNAITTVAKDNLVFEKQQVEVENDKVKKIRIRQATKQGFIECEVGGGMLFGIPNKHFTTRKNNRERSDQPDNNDGECP